MERKERYEEEKQWSSALVDTLLILFLALPPFVAATLLFYKHIYLKG